MSHTVAKKIEERKEFIQIRQHYIDTAQKSSSIFDSSMITLSTWALWASMFFINRDITFSDKPLLTIWRAFLWTTILLTLISFHISEGANRLSVEKHDEEYQWENSKDLCKLSCKIDRKNDILNTLAQVSIVTLILGITFVALFLGSNF